MTGFDWTLRNPLIRTLVFGPAMLGILIPVLAQGGWVERLTTPELSVGLVGVLTLIVAYAAVIVKVTLAQHRLATKTRADV
jgi:hypothetical protein